VSEIGQKKCTVQKVLPAGLFEQCIFSVLKSSKVIYKSRDAHFFTKVLGNVQDNGTQCHNHGFISEKKR